MTSTNRVELKCTTDSELPWKMVPKGSRTSTRRDKKSIVRVAASDLEVEDKSSTGTVARESEAEKLGVFVLGQHFVERVEHVPIKKRRFMVPSLSPKKSSGQCGSSESKTQINHALSVSSGHDFSGIVILADAACSSDMSNDLAPAVDCQPTEEPVVQQQDASTLSTHVEGNDSSAGTAIVIQKYVAVDTRDQVGQGRNDIVAPQKSSVESLCNDLDDEQSIEHSRVTFRGMITAKNTSILLSDESSTERPKANKRISESEILAPDSGAVTMSEKSSASEPTEKNNKSLKDVRLHWDLNVSMDAWAEPCDVEDDASERDVEGEITESMVPVERELIDGSKDHLDGLITSDGQANISSPSRPKAEAAARNGKECQSDYYSQLEDGELREPYHWEENVGDTGEANEESDIEKHVICMNDLHLKKGSSSLSRSLMSKPFKELPSHDAIQRIRSDDYEELSMDPYKFFGRDDRSRMRKRTRSFGRGYFSGWDSRRRFSPPNYKGGSYGFERGQPKGMMDDFDQSGLGPGPGSQPDGYVRKQFSNGGYSGRFRMFSDGRDRDFRGPHSDNNRFPGRMHNRMSGNRRERSNSPVFRRLHYPQQSESRSRSRSPVPWNGRSRISPHDRFRANERMMERVRLPFQKRFPVDQEMGFMSLPRNRMSSPRLFERRRNDYGENHNSFRERKFWPGQRLDVGNSLRRLNSDNNNNNFRPFIRHRRFDGVENNTGGNKFEIAQQQTRRAEVTENGGDDVRQLRSNKKHLVVVANNDNEECNENKIT